MPFGTELVKLTHSAFTFDNSTSLIDVAWRACLSASMDWLQRMYTRFYQKPCGLTGCVPEATDHVIWLILIN